MEARKNTGGVEIVEELPSEFQIKLASELTDPFGNMPLLRDHIAGGTDDIVTNDNMCVGRPVLCLAYLLSGRII